MPSDRTLVVIRERLQIDLFDLALVVIRRRPGPILAAAAAGIAPFALLNAWVLAGAGRAAPALGLTLWWFEAPLATAPLTVVLGALMFARPAPPRTVARAIAGALGPLLLAAGLLRFVPAYWLPPRLVFSNEVLLLERARWTRLWRRGAELAGGRDADLFLAAIFRVVAVLAFAGVGELALGRVIGLVVTQEMAWDITDQRPVAGPTFHGFVWLGVAYLAVVRFLTYIDQRIRLEGWEVELRLRAAGESMAEATRWA